MNSRIGRVIKNGAPAISVGEIPQKWWEQDLLNLIILIAISFVSVYYMPPFVNKIVFIVLLLKAFQSKRNYLWLVWFFIINDGPGRLFSAKQLNDLRIPLYTLTSGISIEFQELFLFAFILKLVLENKTVKFIFQRDFKIFFIVLGLLLAYSFIIGINFSNLIFTLRSVVPWAWIFIVPMIIDSREILYKVSRLVFPFALIALVLQVHSFITGNYLDYTLRGVKFYLQLAVEELDDDSAARAYSAVYISLYATTQALYYLVSKKKTFNPNYLGAVVFAAAISMFLSATRGYILSFSFIIIASSFLMIKSGKIQRIISIAVASLIIISILHWTFPQVSKQTHAAFERFSTLLLLAQGDVTAGGTLVRIDVRGKRVLQGFYESPILGWGFSNTFYEYDDSHVGHQNILLNVGAIGYLYLTYLFFKLCFIPWVYARRAGLRSSEKNTMMVYIFTLLGIFIIHTSTSQFWGYIMFFDQLAKILVWAFILASINTLINTPDTDEGPTQTKPALRSYEFSNR